MRKHGVSKPGLGVALTAVASVAPFNATALAWPPEPAQYTVVEQQNVPVERGYIDVVADVRGTGDASEVTR
jgi:predicted acyl esterase